MRGGSYYSYFSYVESRPPLVYGARGECEPRMGCSSAYVIMLS